MKNILLVEDEKNVASFIKKGLEEDGYRVWMAYEGKAGLEVLNQKEIDLAILDVNLPGMNGFEVCKKIRENDKKELPVIMLTALGQESVVLDAVKSGARDFVVKPFEHDRIMKAITKLLS